VPLVNQPAAWVVPPASAAARSGFRFGFGVETRNEDYTFGMCLLFLCVFVDVKLFIV
jgi:hypothetical protein